MSGDKMFTKEQLKSKKELIPPTYKDLLYAYRELKKDFLVIFNENAQLQMTQFRLTKQEREDLKVLGDGNMTKGLKLLLKLSHEAKMESEGK